MNDFLKKIIAGRREVIGRAKKTIPLADLQKAAKARRPARSLLARLQSNPVGNRANIIAEMKRASPSEGALCPDLDPAKLAREYEKTGAAAISVLTEPKYFLGRDEDIQKARKAVKIPILRKDFTVDPWQVYQSAVLGADVILLIVAALEPPVLKELYAAACEARLETIIEVHTLPELEIALQFQNAIIGVNNRNLATLKTDLSVARELAGYIPKERIVIAESGIKNRSDIEQLMGVGYRGFLIGTSLLKAKSPGAALAELIGATRMPAKTRSPPASLEARRTLRKEKIFEL